MEHNLERNTRLTYIYRLYPSKGTLRYAFSMPLTYRGNGEWEAHAWNSLYKLWPKDAGKMPDFIEILKYIHERIEKDRSRGKLYRWFSRLMEKLFKIHILPYFCRMVGVFEIDRLPVYRRMFGKYFDIVELYDINKEYNEAELNAKYIAFIPKWEN